MAQHSMAAVAHAEDEFHISTGTYVRIAVILFALTALEVGGYEAARRPGVPGHAFAQAWLTEVLILLSAAKFALVAFFYMHLKTDGRLLRWVFGFSLTIAAIVILALMVLMWYMLVYAT